MKNAKLIPAARIKDMYETYGFMPLKRLMMEYDDPIWAHAQLDKDIIMRMITKSLAIMSKSRSRVKPN